VRPRFAIPMPHIGGWQFCAAVMVLVTACSTAPSDSAAPSTGLTPPSAVASVCDPLTAPRLIGPDGTQVVLGNGPGGSSTFQTVDEEVAYVRQIGDCIWIVGYVPLGEDEPPFLSVFHGQLGSDFRIVGTFADINGANIPGHDTGDAVFRVDFEDGELVLVADRTSTGPPGCFGGEGPCPSPIELRRAP
jgi:hypothetical protein